MTPPFQAPDEPDHFAYVKQLAETDSLPTSKAPEQFSAEEIYTLDALHYYNVRQQPQHHTIASHTEQSELESELANAPRERGSTSAGVATSQPPLYYALETIPYDLAGGNILDRLQLMRLLSVIFAALTALFVFLFVKETLPETPWAWTVAGLSVALMPLFGFTSSIVNPDSMLLTVSAATFYLLARAFRRGLDATGAAAIGAAIAIGMLTKLNYVGLIPGVIAGALVLLVRARRSTGHGVWRLLALIVGIGFSPVALYASINVLSNHAAFGIVSTTVDTTYGSWPSRIDYVWQLFLPHIPGTPDYFPGLLTTRQIWFDGYVGLYGWLDTTFPGWVYSLALIPAIAMSLLCCRAILKGRALIRAHLAEASVYALMTIGLFVIIGLDSFRTFPAVGAEYGQARYLLPLLAPIGVGLALTALGAGRKWGPAVGTLIVVLFLAHDVFSQMLVAARFYG